MVASPDGTPQVSTSHASEREDLQADPLPPSNREPVSDAASRTSLNGQRQRGDAVTPEGTADAVRMYLNEVGRVALLTAEAEIDLAKRVDAGRAARTILGTAVSLDPGRRARLRRIERFGSRAKQTMIEANLRLVVSIAKRYLGRGMSLSDLIQEGNIGLMRAVDRFDHRRGYKFSTYAIWWIRQMIGRSVADQARTIRIPVHLVETMNKLRRIERALVQQLGREPSQAEVARAVGMSSARVEELRRLGTGTTSLDLPVGDDAGTSLGELIEDVQAVVPADAAAQRLLHDHLRHVLTGLSARERLVLEWRFGLADTQPRTLEEVGEALGLTRERIRQIEVKALAKLRHPRHADALRGYLEV